MTTIINEFKKAAASPVVIALILIFIAFNLFVIYGHYWARDELKIMNQIFQQVGTEINEDMRVKLEEQYQKALDDINSIAKDKGVEVISLLENPHELSQGERSLIIKGNLLEVLRDMIDDIDQIYEEIDLGAVAEDEITKFGLQGRAADAVRKQYLLLTDRLNDLKDAGEHKHLFFIGPIYHMHSLLFKTLYRWIIFEVMILAVLITSHIMSYEFENESHLLAYSTKRGRNLQIDKLWASLFSTILATTLVLGITLTAYFMIFDYSALKNVPISSYFNGEYRLPYISWWPLSLQSYLLLSAGLLYLCQILFTGITYLLANIISGSYRVFFAFAILMGGLLLLPGYMPKSSILILAAGFTPFTMILNPMAWFMEGGAFATFQYYEVLTMACWGMMVALLGGLLTSKFMRRDIL
ncbi:hypothetical protein [Alkaliphilus crotonatoxidans]